MCIYTNVDPQASHYLKEILIEWVYIQGVQVISRGRVDFNIDVDDDFL